MTCTTNSGCKGNTDGEIVSRTEFKDNRIGEEGRVISFHHEPSSEYPIRNVSEKNKTEPCIEEEAENFHNECYQNHVEYFLDSKREKYLFLMTTCQNDYLEQYGEKFIVGYVEKGEKLDMGDHLAVRGTTRIVSFEEALRINTVSDADNPKNTRVKCFDKLETEEIVSTLEEGENILEECVEEVEELKEEADASSGSTCSSC